jgi:hypothetical protein
MNDGIVWIGKQSALLTKANAVLITDKPTPTVFDEKNLNIIENDKYRVAPWGIQNLLPQNVMGLIEHVEIIGTNSDFNARVCYGNGPKVARLMRDENGKIRDWAEVTEGKEYDWFLENNVPQLALEILTDLSYFHNAFPLFVFDKNFTGIKRMLHREAMFSRWGLDDADQIKWLLYSSKWDKSPGSIPDNADIEKSFVIDEFAAVKDIQTQLKAKAYKRVCMALYLPSPGRPYYSYPNWYSIFRSGWYDQIRNIPELKSAILEHNLGIRHIIYVSDKYFAYREKQEGISPDDIEKRKEFKKKVVKELNDWACGAENQGKSMTVLKEMTGNGNTEEKYITVETIQDTIKEGEFIADYETVANIISYAMGVHPSLIGAVPGKNSNSLSGSNIREIYLMKQAQMRPYIDLALRPFSIVKQVNGWNKDIAVVMPEYIFTTLDQNKSGKQESTNTYAK